MKISRQWQSMIVLAALYVIFLTTMVIRDLWKWHDSTNLLLHISVLTNLVLLFGLLFWFGQRWKYFRIGLWVVFLTCCIVSTIHDWQKRDPWGYIFYPIWSIWGLYCLKEEIVKHMTIDDSQETSNEHLPGSVK
jgi:hypothetical protein